MKYLLLILAFTYALFNPKLTYATISGDVARQELIQTAKRVQERERLKSERKELELRVQRESARLGVSADPGRTNAVRLILVYFGDKAPIALAISKAESGLRCGAVGDGGDSIGLFQINKAHFRVWSRDSLFDCETNVKAAAHIYQTSGWWPWSVFKNKSYLNWI